MKKFVFLSAAVLFLAGCASDPQVRPANQAAGNQYPAAQKPGTEVPVTAHSTENQFPPAKNGNANSSSGSSPMSKAVDVGAMTANIETAEKAYQKEPKNSQAKTDLAHAYFVRAFALTEAAQYRAALGDFRKGLNWIRTIRKPGPCTTR